MYFNPNLLSYLLGTDQMIIHYNSYFYRLNPLKKSMLTITQTRHFT